MIPSCSPSPFSSSPSNSSTSLALVEALRQLSNEEIAEFPNVFACALMISDDETDALPQLWNGSFAKRPFYRPILSCIQQWADHLQLIVGTSEWTEELVSQFTTCDLLPPSLSLEPLPGYIDHDALVPLISVPLLRSLQFFASCSQDLSLITENFRTLLLLLGVRGVLSLLRIRNTPGSLVPTASTVEICKQLSQKSLLSLPPRRSELIRSINQLHKPRVKLSVGGRALCKHGQRSNDLWWGSFSGSEEIKNRNAQSIIERLIDNAIWLNVHHLPVRSISN